MKFLDPLFTKILEALLTHQVEFLLIGGYAVNYHGYGRPTGDMDIWLKPDNENKTKAIVAFRYLQFSKSDIEIIDTQNFEDPLVFFHGKPPLRIDFITKVNLVDFNKAWQERNILQLQNLSIPVVNYEHLILTKISVGRAKDKQDVEELQKINQGKNKKERPT